MTEPEVARTRISAFERRLWRVQRISWWSMGMLLVAGLLGAFGGGPLSESEVSVPGTNARLRYERIVRLGQDGSVDWRGLHAVGDSVNIELAFDPAHFSLSTEGHPQPERVRVTTGGMLLSFASFPGSTTEISTSLVPRRPGILPLRARAGKGEWMDLSIIVFPED